MLLNFFLIMISIINVTTEKTTPSAGNLTEFFLDTTLIICTKKAAITDERFVKCQQISNMFISDNGTLKCTNSSLKVSFTLFQHIIHVSGKGTSLNQSEESLKHTQSPVETSAFLTEMDVNETEPNIVRHEITEKDDQKACKKLRK